MTEDEQVEPGAAEVIGDLDAVGIHEALQAIAVEVELLDGRGPLPCEQRIAAWHAAAAVLDIFKVVVGQMEQDALNAMIELGLDETATPFGPVHLAPGYGAERWDGDGVLSALTRKLVDTDTGEYIDAVPTNVLRKVIPAVTPGSTSSKWSKTGLRKAGVRVDHYLRAEPKPMVIRRGERWQP